MLGRSGISFCCSYWSWFGFETGSGGTNGAACSGGISTSGGESGCSHAGNRGGSDGRRCMVAAVGEGGGVKISCTCSAGLGDKGGVSI